MNGNTKRPWRVNVLALSGAVTAITCVSMAAAVTGTAGELSNTMMNVALVGVTGLVSFGKDILKLDENPFDAQEAAHAERLKEFEVSGAIRMKQLELDHEFRNGQNAAMQSLIDAVTGRGGS